MSEVTLGPSVSAYFAGFARHFSTHTIGAPLAGGFVLVYHVDL